MNGTCCSCWILLLTQASSSSELLFPWLSGEGAVLHVPECPSSDYLKF